MGADPDIPDMLNLAGHKSPFVMKRLFAAHHRNKKSHIWISHARRGSTVDDDKNVIWKDKLLICDCQEILFLSPAVGFNVSHPQEIKILADSNLVLPLENFAQGFSDEGYVFPPTCKTHQTYPPDLPL